VTRSEPSDAPPAPPSTRPAGAGAEVPPDPAAYDSERNAAARKRGLSTPYIPGGRDPDPNATQRTERRDMKILLGMVVAIVLAGFVLGILAALLGLNGLVARPA
jgi:hypothetical protein